MDRLKALATFKAVVDQGGFARAAATLDVSCAVVTRSVQDLEALLGVRLLQRTTRRVSLTTVGREVLDHAAQLLDGYARLAALGSLAASDAAGTVRLAAPVSYARRCLGPALASFAAAHPRIGVELRFADGALDGLDGDADLVLCRAQALRPAMVARRVAEAEVGLYAAPDYLARHGVPAHPQALAAHGCLAGDEAATGGVWRLHRGGGDGRDAASVPVRGGVRSNDAELLIGAAVHGAGVVLQPAFMVDDAVAAGRLLRVLPGWRGEPFTLHLASLSRHRPQAVRLLADHLANALGSAAPAAAARDAPWPPRPVPHRPEPAAALAA